MAFLRLVSLLFVAINTVLSANILLIPFLEGSHLQWMAHLGRTLKSRDHKITVLTMQNEGNLKTLEGLSTIIYKSYHTGYKSSEEWSQSLFTQILEKDFEGRLTTFGKLEFYLSLDKTFAEEGEQLLFNNSDVMKAIGDSHFDLVVLDGVIFTAYNFLIPYKFGIPYISIENLWAPVITRIPLFPVTPVSAFEHTDEMTTAQRFVNFMVNMFIGAKLHSDKYVTNFVPEKPYKPVIDIMRDAELHIIHNAPPVDYPKPSLPHVKILPSLTIRRAKPLEDKELISFINESRDGFILVSLGTFIRSMPSSVNQKFAAAFSQIQQGVIWKFSGRPPENLSKNVKVVSWMPQIDLLAHPSIRLFVSHCGNNGQHEALYYGVPVLGTPVLADQMYNARRGEHKGYGLRLNLHNFSVDEMVSKINEIVYNPKYKTRSMWASGIMQDDPLLPAERAAYWIEHVLKFGSSHLKSPSIYLPWYQYYMVDFLVLFTSGIVVFILTVICCIKFTVLRLLKVLTKAKYD